MAHLGGNERYRLAPTGRRLTASGDRRGRFRRQHLRQLLEEKGAAAGGVRHEILVPDEEHAPAGQALE